MEAHEVAGNRTPIGTEARYELKNADNARLGSDVLFMLTRTG
jgi:hypothetical protein